MPGATAAEPVDPEPPRLPGRALLTQQWADVVFLHWPYRAAEVQQLLPRGVLVDTFDGDAWVGLIPFEMRDLRPIGVPPIPGLRCFVEVNVRTYVRDARGRRAVWFFSLDVPHVSVVAAARAAVGVRYCLARASHSVHERNGRERHAYRTMRRWPRGPATARVDVEVGTPIVDADLDPLSHFLTARWAALTTWRGRLLRSPVTHRAWPLHRARALGYEQNLVQAAGLRDPIGPPLVLFSRGVEATFSGPRSV